MYGPLFLFPDRPNLIISIFLIPQENFHFSGFSSRSRLVWCRVSEFAAPQFLLKLGAFRERTERCEGGEKVSMMADHDYLRGKTQVTMSYVANVTQ